MALAIIKYTFQFDPTDTWNSLSQFEKVITESLGSIGLEANLTVPLGAPSTERWIIITKKQEQSVATPPKVSLKDNLKNLRDPNVYKSPNSYK